MVKDSAEQIHLKQQAAEIGLEVGVLVADHLATREELSSMTQPIVGVGCLLVLDSKAVVQVRSLPSKQTGKKKTIFNTNLLIADI